MAKRTTQSDINIDEILRDVDEIKTMVRENTCVLSGRDGSPGLVGKVELLRAELTSEIAALKVILTNDLAHMSARMDLEFSAREKLQLSESKNNITRGEVLKEWIKPVITAIVTAIAVYIITKGL